MPQSLCAKNMRGFENTCTSTTGMAPFAESAGDRRTKQKHPPPKQQNTVKTKRSASTRHAVHIVKIGSLATNVLLFVGPLYVHSSHTLLYSAVYLHHLQVIHPKVLSVLQPNLDFHYSYTCHVSSARLLCKVRLATNMPWITLVDFY